LSGLVLGAAIVVSVGLGLSRRVPRGLAIVANVALALALIPVAAHLADPSRHPATLDYAQQERQLAEAQRFQQSLAGLSFNGELVKNIYPYDRRGHLLHDVRLFGDRGVPLDVGSRGEDPSRRAVTTKDGPVLNAFPIRYFDPGTGKVADPDAGPEVVAPPLETPPLK
jgi:hypothetical protein